MNKAYGLTKWIVALDTPEKRDPRVALVLCVVDIRSEQEYSEFDAVLRKEGLCAYTERSYGQIIYSRQGSPKSISLSTFKRKLEEYGWKRTLPQEASEHKSDLQSQISHANACCKKSSEITKAIITGLDRDR